MPLIKTCRWCQQNFEITAEDVVFYEKVSPVFDGKKYLIPPPTLCPPCREKRRLVFRNERVLYPDICDRCGKEILSLHGPAEKYKVYCPDCWWKEESDARNYGRRFDFNRTFTEQFRELIKSIPLMALISINNENCAYNNSLANSKNCYCVIASSNDEDCYYGYWLQKSSQCVDCSFSHEMTIGYENDNCYNSYNLKWCRDSLNCKDSMFLLDCIGCSDCIGCTGLRQKRYCILNEQKTKSEYEAFVKKFDTGSSRTVADFKKKWEEHALTIPRKYVRITGSENCSGDYIFFSKNCSSCFHAHEAEECKYAEHVWRNSRFNMDVNTVGRDAELIYESMHAAINAYNCAFVAQTLSSSDMYYTFQCFHSQKCFGSAGLRKNEYCILNQQYTKEEYESLVPRIIEYMRETGEWGEFFDASISPWAYNETMAAVHYPASPEEVKELGFRWSDYQPPLPEVKKIVSPEQMKRLPDHIKDIPDDIIHWALTCEISGKLFKIIKPELIFYRDHAIPLPRRHPDQRHQDRMLLRNPKKLWDRHCMKCGKPIQTTYAPQRPEIIYCEECYLKEVY